MVAKIDRTGERNINNFGSEMIIIRHRNYHDIDVYFPKYDWISKGRDYGDFKNKKISCPYERRTFGVGFIGEGEYEITKNGKTTKCYDTRHSMLRRCYSEKEHKKYPTYINCKVCDEWLNFQNFAKWYYENYYEIEGQRTTLDKDIVHKGNKTYSPENCVFVPNNINALFVKNDKNRGEYPIGVNIYKRTNKYRAYCNVYDEKTKRYKNKHLGYFNSVEQAFNVYKQFKENYIKQVADEYKGKIPKKLYDALYDYQVSIND